MDDYFVCCAGSIRTGQGQFTEAINLFEQVLQIDEHNENAQKYIEWLKPAGS